MNIINITKNMLILFIFLQRFVIINFFLNSNIPSVIAFIWSFFNIITFSLIPGIWVTLIVLIVSFFYFYKNLDYCIHFFGHDVLFVFYYDLLWVYFWKKFCKLQWNATALCPISNRLSCSFGSLSTKLNISRNPL